MSRSQLRWVVSPGSRHNGATETFEPSDALLMQICQVSDEDVQALPGWLDTTRRVSRIICLAQQESQLELAITLLASQLGQIARHNPVHLPFGFTGPTIQSRHWVDQATLGRIAKQIVGLIWPNQKPMYIAHDVTGAIEQAVQLGFLEQKEYDAWRPGMASGSGWRTATMATPYGLARADMLVTSIMAAHDEAGPDPVSPKPASPVPVMASDADQARDDTDDLVTDDRYAWARQAELVNAVSQVVGQGTLHKGVLSRACRSGQIQTNGQPGRASRVSVTHFLAWAAQQFSISSDEQVQLRNAIIGEINARNL